MMKQFETSSHDYNSDLLDAPIAVNDRMTLSGTLNKSIFLLGILIVSAFAAATIFPSSMMMYLGMGGAFITAIVVSFKPNLAPLLSPAYAIFKGIFLGIVSLHYSYLVDGIVFKAAGLTVTTLVIMLMIYRAGLIPVTAKFKMAVVSATMGIMLMYVVSFVMNMFFGIDPVYLHDGGWLSIGLSVLIIGVAALNFLLDFDMIEKGVQNRSPKYMEWYGGFAVLVTLAWLYFEFLRLIAMLASD